MIPVASTTVPTVVASLLARSREHRKKLVELREALRDWCREIRDTGFLPEGEIHSRSAGSTPGDMARDDSKYPFDRIFAAAGRDIQYIGR